MSTGVPDLPSGINPTEVWYRRWAERAVELARSPAGELAVSQGFVARRGQLHALGLNDNDLRRVVRRREWSTPDRGVFSPVVAMDDGYLGDRERHALRSTAAALLRPDHVVSAGSAAVLHGLPVLALPDAPLLTTRGDDTAGRRYGVHVRTARVSDEWVTSWFGTDVSSVARTVVDLARVSRYDGIMAADAALHESITTRSELARALECQAGWPGVRQAREIVALADGDAESPLESLVRLALHDDGFPPPKLQRWVAGYRVDLVWPEYRLILEADGRVKYTGDEGWNEKKRHLALGRLHWDVERVVWADLFGGWPATARRLRPYFAFPAGSVGFRPAK